jgi:hypothetical protein
MPFFWRYGGGGQHRDGIGVLLIYRAVSGQQPVVQRAEQQVEHGIGVDVGADVLVALGFADRLAQRLAAWREPVVAQRASRSHDLARQYVE